MSAERDPASLQDPAAMAAGERQCSARDEGADWRGARAPDEPSDERLMLDYAGGDAAAFARLFDRHERPVYRFLLRSLGGDPAIADDVLQEVWLAVVRNASTYEVRAKFTTWLYGIARTRLIDHWRRRREDASLDAPAGGREDTNDDGVSWVEQIPGSRADEPDVRALSRAQACAFLRAVESLPLVQREAFLLHAEAGLDLADIARITGVGTETAKSRLRYAMSKLRAAMEDWR